MSTNHGNDEGGLSPPEGAGTPFAVDVSPDREKRWMWAMFLSGPVVWLSHYGLVYLVAEAGCTGGGPGLELLDPPVPVTLTLLTTVAAIAACLAATVWSFRRWRLTDRHPERAPDDAKELAGDEASDDRAGSLAFGGFVLGVFSIVAILFTAAPALVLGPC